MTDVLAQSMPDCLVPPVEVGKELAKECKQRIGTVISTIPVVARVPWLADVTLEGADPHFAFVDKDCLDKIGAVSSHANACRHCYGTVYAYLKLLGYDEDTIVALQGEISAGHFDEKMQIVLKYVRSLAIADVERRVYLQKLTDLGVSQKEIAEITYYTALMATSHRVNSPLAVPLESIEVIAAKPLAKLFRPLIAMLLNSKGGPSPIPSDLPGDWSEGPFKAAVEALQGCPAAPVLRSMIDRALASTFVSGRERGLVLAVIARGIGSLYMEAEARALLHAESLDDAVIDGALDNLRHPDLSEDEIAVMGYARNSVRNPMPALQNGMKELSKGKSAEWIVDIAGQVAFANTIARLCVLVD